MLKNVVRSVVQKIPKTGKRCYSQDNLSKMRASMDDLPIPCGSWQEAYDKKQRIYNIQLIGGILFALTTIYTAKTSGLVYLNWNPPTLEENE